MAYTNQYGRNPIKMSNDIEIRSGTAINGEAVADEYVALGYEPALGTQYLSTAGQVFIHHKSGTVANTWYKVTDAPEPDLEAFSVTTILTPALQPFVLTDNHSVTTSLAGDIFKSISSVAKSVTATLGATMEALVNPIVKAGISLSVSMTAVLTNVHEIFNVSLSLGASYNKAVTYLKGYSGSVTLGADVTISVNP